MQIALVSDAWVPQVNGVVRTFQNLNRELDRRGIAVVPIVPGQYRTLPCPTYPEIRLALAPPGAVGRKLGEIDPDHIHIATEGPLGVMARRWCLKRGRSFTTSFHTRFPEYLSARFPLPEGPVYSWLARFHNAGTCCMVATESLERDLETKGFAHLCRWSRGVDTDLFCPSENSVLDL
ncbi:MAG: glycosyltransferase, partial [Hyphomicrobiales bacterium]|nr:glycosyltransferase [Hyphomicrobiales bacterium]